MSLGGAASRASKVKLAGGFRAGLLKSFGFGQAGAEILVVHPDYLLGSLDAAAYAHYAKKRGAREAKAFRYHQGVYSGLSFVGEYVRG